MNNEIFLLYIGYFLNNRNKINIKLAQFISKKCINFNSKDVERVNKMWGKYSNE